MVGVLAGNLVLTSTGGTEGPAVKILAGFQVMLVFAARKGNRGFLG
jgi:hypothetical protein